MTLFTMDQWLVMLLIFLLGLFLGMAFLANPKWKRRYREEAARREAVEAENAQLRRDAGEMESLRGAAARDADRRRDETTAERRVADADRRVAERRAEDIRADDDGVVRSQRLADEEELRRRDEGRGPL